MENLQFHILLELQRYTIARFEALHQFFWPLACLLTLGMIIFELWSKMSIQIIVTYPLNSSFKYFWPLYRTRIKLFIRLFTCLPIFPCDWNSGSIPMRTEDSCRALYDLQDLITKFPMICGFSSYLKSIKTIPRSGFEPVT